MAEKSLIGTTVGNYEVVGTIGSGAMGMVFEGLHPQIGKRVAIKVLAPHLTHVKAITRRFIQEAKTINKIEHPNIIEIYDFGQLEDERYYYSMELLQGETLSEKMKRQNIPFGEILEITAEVCDALEAVHEQGIIHRDLKPGNVFLAQKGRKITAKVLDFGVAKLMEPGEDAEYETSAGSVLGTPVYMSPEQAMGKISEISAAADIYAVGVIVYRMLTGHLPVKGGNIGAIISKHITEEVPPLTLYNQQIPPRVSDVVIRCIAKAPDERYSSAWEFFKALKEAGQHVAPDTVFNLRPPRGARPRGDEASGSNDYYFSFDSSVKKPDEIDSGPLMPPTRADVLDVPPPPPPSEGSLPGIDEVTPQQVFANDDMSQSSQFEYSQFPSGSYVDTHVSGAREPKNNWVMLGAGAVLLLIISVASLWFFVLREKGGRSSNEPATPPPAAPKKNVIVAMVYPMKEMKPTVVLPNILKTMKPVIKKVRISAYSALADVKAVVIVGTKSPTKHELPFVISVPKGEKITIEASHVRYQTRKYDITALKDTKLKVELTPVKRVFVRPMNTMRPMSGMSSVGDGLL